MRALLLTCLMAACGPADDAPPGAVEPTPSPTSTGGATTSPTLPTGTTPSGSTGPTALTGATGQLDTGPVEVGGDCTVGGPDLLLTDAGVELTGDQPEAGVGNAMVAMGDITGDGLADVLVGSDRGNTLYLLAGDPGVTAGPLDTAAWAVISGEAGGAIGASLSAAGDVDGDGLMDVWVGDYQLDGGRGGAYLLRAADLLPGRHDITGLTDIRILGTEPDEATAKVVGLGDVTGDGIHDVALTSDRYDEGRGIVQVLAGPFGGDRRTDTAHATYRGTEAGDELSRVLGPGDLDGDGDGDLVLFATGAHERAGVAYVVPGPIPAGVTVGEDIPGRWSGAYRGLLGKSAAALDLEGDGIVELLVGSPYAQDRRGHAYLLRGIPTTGVPVMDAADGYWAGVRSEDRVGFAVASAGDTDGDGAPEFLIGAKGESSGAGDGGAIFLVADPPTGLVPMAPGSYQLKIAGDTSYEFLGKPLSAGDLDGDGWPDLVIGAHNRDTGARDAGAVFVRPCAR